MAAHCPSASIRLYALSLSYLKTSIALRSRTCREMCRKDGFESGSMDEVRGFTAVNIGSETRLGDVD